MTEFSLYTLLISDFFHFCFLILSHPLYFSYFFFFFPYLLKVLSFLSPLVTTTSLLLLAFFTVPPGHGHGLVHDQDTSRSESSETKFGFLATTYQVVSGNLSLRMGHENEESPHFEELELYKIVFETCRFETREIPDEVLEVDVEMDCSHALESVITEKNPSHGDDINSIIVPFQGSQKSDENQTELEFEQEKKEKESKLNPKQDTEIPELDGVDEEKQIESRAASFETKDVEVITDNDSENYNSEVKENDSQALEMKFTSFGSTRKETAWRKTLACKLFEERYDIAVGNEEMDLLWERYEMESMGKVEVKSNSQKDLKTWVDQHEEEEEEEESEGKICCLQALKFSTGKMRFGMGRTSSLVKISKAFKGFKLLQQASRNGKKRHS